MNADVIIVEVYMYRMMQICNIMANPAGPFFVLFIQLFIYSLSQNNIPPLKEVENVYN